MDNDSKDTIGTLLVLRLVALLGSLCTEELIESGVNVKVVQEVLGHKNVSITLDIYTDVTKELARREFEGLEEKMNENLKSAEVEK